MKQLLKNISATIAFGTVAFMHVYFVLLLLAKPALAENQNTTKTETVEKKQPTLDEDATKEFQFNMNGAKGTVKLNKNGIQITSDETDDKSVDDEDDDSENIKISKKMISVPVMAAGVMEDLEDIVVPVVLFLSAFGFAAYVVYAKSRTRREYLETVRALAQSGQPIPPELLSNMNATINGGKMWNPAKTTYDANAAQGIKYIFWGVGFAGFMMCLNRGSFAMAIGFLFIVMGAYHIYISQMMQKQKLTETVATPPPTENK